jgi:hypothetical protein
LNITVTITKCHPTSRCKTDKNYEASRIVITSSKAKKLLDSVIRRSTIYKAPGDYVSAKDTFYVESFNNVINIFQDKRISFSGEQYKFRLNLAVLHWNENVDRKYTSIWQSRNPNAPTSQRGKKVYKVSYLWGTLINNDTNTIVKFVIISTIK